MTARQPARRKYRRILLKLSGEALQNRAQGLSIDPQIVAGISRRIRTVHRLGIEVAVVVGGGNIFRGSSGEARGIGRNSGDYMGMLATIINGLALQNSLEKHGLATRLMTAIEMRSVAEPFILRRALRHLEKRRVLIFAGGTGNPYFTTDTGAALRAAEINAEALLKATNVDGVYERDPNQDPTAKKLDRLTYREALRPEIAVMDATAISLSMDTKIPVIVFDLLTPGNIKRVLLGEAVGSIIN